MKSQSSTILITGGKGKLASHLINIIEKIDQYSVLAPSKSELDITNRGQIKSYLDAMKHQNKNK